MVLKKRLLTALAVFLAYLISSILITDIRYTDKPEFETAKIREQIAESTGFAGRALASVAFSAAQVFKTNTPEKTGSSSLSPDPTEAPVNTNSPVGFSNLPTATPAPVPPTAIPPSAGPTAALPTGGPTPLQPTAKPTSAPKPTAPPKPTATPAPAPITSDIRPGESIEAILREVSKRACIPYALLMATRTIESGVWFNNMSTSTAKTYNTYGWWKTAGKSTVCAGLAYYTQSGKIPPDSTAALQEGASCTNGAQPGAYDQQIMGLMQISQQEQDVSRKYTQSTLPNNIDRRVLFDNALIYAWITKNRAGKSPQPSCDDWPEETVRLVAEKHFGACAYPGGNYCDRVWNYYQQYK